MLDLLSIAATVIFFLLSLAYVRGCEKLWLPLNWPWLCSWPSVSPRTWCTRCCARKSS